jgi:hypothetical protein
VVVRESFCFSTLWKGWIAVKKLIASLLLVSAVMFTTVGCGEDAKKPATGGTGGTGGAGKMDKDKDKPK